MSILTEMLAVRNVGHFVRVADHDTARDQPEDYLVIWVVAGRGTAQTEGQTCQARAGDLLTFVPHKPHHYFADADDPWEIFWFHCSGDAAAGLVGDLRSAEGEPFLSVGLDAELRNVWLQAVAGHRLGDVASAPLSSGRVLDILGRLIWLREQCLGEGPARDVGGLALSSLQQFVAEHLHEPLSLDDLARQAHLSPAHFSRVFKQVTGLSPMQYVARQRMAQAGFLLSETHQPVKQVAAAVGYDDAYYFSRHFKQLVGMSPKAYREQQRG